MKIGIDIDEVIVEFLKGYLEIYEKIYGKKGFYKDFHSYNFWECLPISKEQAIRIAEEFFDSEEFENIEFVKGAKQAVQTLSKNHELIFLTARPVKIKEKTIRFFNKHFPESSFEIFHSGDFFAGNKSKAEICKDLGISFLIEDNEHYALDCSKNCEKVFLLDKPWNQNMKNQKNIIRVKNWQEIMEMLK